MSERISGENPGLLDSLTSLAATLVSAVRTRVNLLSLDLEEDVQSFLSLLILVLGTMFCLGVGVVLSAMLLVLAFWDTYRLLTLSLLTALFLASGLLAAVAARKKARNKPRVFASSLAEFQKDAQQLAFRS